MSKEEKIPEEDNEVDEIQNEKKQPKTSSRKKISI